jgi:hypothetical protein
MSYSIQFQPISPSAHQIISRARAQVRIRTLREGVSRFPTVTIAVTVVAVYVAVAAHLHAPHRAHLSAKPSLRMGILGIGACTICAL